MRTTKRSQRSGRTPGSSALALTLITALSVAACGDETSSPSTTGQGGSAGAGGIAGAAGAVGEGGGGMDGLPESFTVDGFVVDENGDPVEGAVVRQGGTELTATSDATGAFSIEVRPGSFIPPTLVANKTAYRTRGFEIFEVYDAPIQIVLHTAFLPDNEAYTYQDPGDGEDTEKEDCSHCHATFVRQFLTSKHAQAARNPLVQDLYAGVSRAHGDQGACEAAGGEWKTGLEPGTSNTVDKCYLGGGVLPDLNTCGGSGQPACDDPQNTVAATAFGACADCHAPAIDGVAGGRDLHEAQGLAFDKGVSCDPCHKVQDIDPTQPPGVGGKLILQRPGEPGTNTFTWKPLFFGPLPGVANVFMGGAIEQPKFKRAVYCSGCHEQQQAALLDGEQIDATRWPNGLPTHSTFSEWQAGPYMPDVACQYCHMPARFDMVNSLDDATADNQSIKFGWVRDAQDTRQHIFRSPLHRFDGSGPRLVDEALFTSVSLSQAGSALTASVSIANVGCGHAMPTGEPMRALVLLVQASGSCGELTPIGGATVNDVGGARAEGVVGTDVVVAGPTLTWAAPVNVGDVVRAVRPSGAFHDYPGIGFFADGTLTPADKGMPVQEPVGQATVTGVGGGDITLDASLSLQAGDILYVGDAWSGAVDAAASANLAGAPGHAFARVLVDSGGVRQVPHYRAIDMVSDNRIAPGDSALTTHVFDVPAGCTNITVSASVIYRPVPTHLARERGWAATDYVVSVAEAQP